MMLFKMDLIMSIEIIQINCMVLFKIVFMKMKVIESLWKIMKLGLKNIEIKLKIKNSIFRNKLKSIVLPLLLL